MAVSYRASLNNQIMQLFISNQIDKADTFVMM